MGTGEASFEDFFVTFWSGRIIFFEGLCEKEGLNTRALRC